MRLLSLTLLCIAPLSLTRCNFGNEGSQETDAAFEREMISAHNSVRISATPTPNPALPVLSWSAAAAGQAQAWADQCQYAHNPNLGNFGENIAAATPNTWATAGVVQFWASEASSY